MVINRNSTVSLEEAAAAFGALGSVRRLAVLRALVRAGDDGLSIGELGRRSGITGANLTHHTRALAAAGLVVQRRQGRHIICAAVSYDYIRALADFLLESCCVDAGSPEKEHTNG